MLRTATRKLPGNLEDRATLLSVELDRTTNHYRRAGKLNKFLAGSLAMVAIGATGAIAISGMLFDVSSRLLGAVALLPAAATLANAMLRPHDRANWCFTKKNRVSALRRRLLFEVPLPLSEASVAVISERWAEIDSEIDRASISERWAEIDSEIDALWEKAYRVNWAAAERSKPAK